MKNKINSHSNKRLENPMHYNIDKYYLNDVSIKCRYNLMEYSKIGEKLGHKFTDQNMFNKVSLGGRALDNDIKAAYKFLTSRSNEGLDYFQKLDKINNEEYLNHMENHYKMINNKDRKLPKLKSEFDFDNKPNWELKKRNEDMYMISESDKHNELETIKNIKIPSNRENIHKKSFLNQNSLILKKPARKSSSLPGSPVIKSTRVNHDKKFSVYNKNKLDINEKELETTNFLESPVQRKESINKLLRMKSIDKKKTQFRKKTESPKKLNIFLQPISNEFNLHDFYDFTLNELDDKIEEDEDEDLDKNLDKNNSSSIIENKNLEEYDKINYEENGTIQLIKNYLIHPKAKKLMSIKLSNSALKKSSSNNVFKSPQVNKGIVNLNHLLSEEDQKLKDEDLSNVVIRHAENGQIILSKSKSIKKKRKISDISNNKNNSSSSPYKKKDQALITMRNFNRNNSDVSQFSLNLPLIKMEREEDILLNDEKKRINKIKNKNNEKRNHYVYKNKVDLANFVEDSRIKLNNIDGQIKKILTNATYVYDKIEKKL